MPLLAQLTSCYKDYPVWGVSFPPTEKGFRHKLLCSILGLTGDAKPLLSYLDFLNESLDFNDIMRTAYSVKHGGGHLRLSPPPCRACPPSTLRLKLLREEPSSHRTMAKSQHPPCSLGIPGSSRGQSGTQAGAYG